MSDIFGNLDNFLENYDENNLSANSNLSFTGSGIANDALGIDHSRRQNTSTATKNNSKKSTKNKKGVGPSQNIRNKTATTSTVTSTTTSSVIIASTPAPAPSVVDLTTTSLLSIAEEMKSLFQLFQSIFNSKNPIVIQLLKNREASKIKRSFSTLNNSYNRKPPVTANEVMQLNKKIDSARTNLTQLAQKIKSTIDPVSADQPSPYAGRSRNTTARNHLGPPIVISLDCDDDPVSMQTAGRFRSGRVTRRSRANASVAGGSESNVITIDSDDDSLSECDGQQLNSTNRANNSFETENYIMRIKVKWGGSIEMFEHRRFQKFGDIIDQLAEKESADSTCIFLNLDDRIVYPNDTPDSINYKPNQFISGRILRSKAPDRPAAPVPSSSNNNSITLKIQMKTRKKPLQLQIDKQQTMSVLVIKCAEELKCEPKDIKLYFDGELVDNSSKPEDLDLEGEEILDIRFTK